MKTDQSSRSLQGSFPSIASLGPPSARAEAVNDYDSLQQIFRLRYDAYVVEQGKRYPWADHSRCLLPDPFDTTALRQFVLRDLSGHIIAAVRTHEVPPAQLAHQLGVRLFAPWAGHPLYYVSKLVVKRQYRNSSLLKDLVIGCFQDGEALGAPFSLIHSSPRLVPIYRRVGFSPYMPSFIDDFAGEQQPMVYVGCPWSGASTKEEEMAPLKWLLEQFEVGAFSLAKSLNTPA